MSCAIPIIDWNDPDIISKLRVACADVGFFYLVNHNISTTNKVLEESRKFFDMSASSKRAVRDPILNRGYTSMEEETLDPSVQTKGDTKEGTCLFCARIHTLLTSNVFFFPLNFCFSHFFHHHILFQGFYIGRDVAKSSADYNPSKFSGPNPWPTPSSCPELSAHDCETFRFVMRNYYDQMNALSHRLLCLVARAIGLDDDTQQLLFNNNNNNTSALIRLLHYAAVPSNPEQGIFACGAHSDYGLLTLLLTDDNHGLQIYRKQENTWMDVPPLQGAFVVNLGDMLEHYTNGLFPSTRHRVLTTNGAGERYSIPFFFEPAFDTVVECWDCCCSDENPAKYRPTTFGQYLKDKYAQTHADYEPTRSEE
jgi:isopenicillin N synthase-like dioxygenase